MAPKPVQKEPTFIAAFVGARPQGRGLPPLRQVPAHSEVPLHLIYAFARDAKGDGKFEFYEPAHLENARSQQGPGHRGMLSLAGAGFPWRTPANIASWVQNAQASVKALLVKHNLVGLDINYEEGLGNGESFAKAVGGLIKELKQWRPSLVVSISPYVAIWEQYKKLLEVANDGIDYINWQLYAELEAPTASTAQVVEVYERLAGEKLVGGFRRLTLGVNTEPDLKRGPRLPALLAAFKLLKARGLGGAFVWALENSGADGFKAEAALLEAAAGSKSGPVQEATVIYKLQAGDSAWELEQKNGWPAGTLQRLNPDIKDWSKVWVGQPLIVPAPAGAERR